MNIEEKLLGAGFEDVVYFPDFDEGCIIGIDINGRVVYSYEKMIESLIDEGYEEIEAIECLEYNTIGSLGYIDNKTNGRAPIIMYSRDWLGI